MTRPWQGDIMIKLRSRYLGIVFLYFCLGAHPEIGADATLLSMMDRGVSSSTPLVHAVQATAKTNSQPRQQN